MSEHRAGPPNPVLGFKEGFWECLGSWEVIRRQSVPDKKTEQCE